MRITFLALALMSTIGVLAHASPPIGFENQPAKRSAPLVTPAASDKVASSDTTANAAVTIKEVSTQEMKKPDCQNKNQPPKKLNASQATNKKKKKLGARSSTTTRSGVSFKQAQGKDTRTKPVFYYAHSVAQHYGVLFFNTPCKNSKALAGLKSDLRNAGIDHSDRTVLRRALSKLPSGEEYGCWYVDPRVGSFNLRLEGGTTQEFAREQIEKVRW